MRILYVYSCSLENLLKHAKRRNTHQKLDCSSAVELDFSMDVFEHLQAMRDRHALKIAEDIELNEILSDYVSDLDLFGGALREALTRVSISVTI